MGNCICNSNKTPDSPEKRYAGIEQQAAPANTPVFKLIDPFEKHHDVTETTIEVSLGTGPLTPSTVASSQFGSSPTNEALIPMSKIQKGRALQARLAKARRMQMALQSEAEDTTALNWPLITADTGPPPMETIATDGPVTCCVYDDEGSLYTATATGKVTKDGKVLVHQTSNIRSIAVQGSTLVTGGDDHACRVYRNDDTHESTFQRMDRVYAVDTVDDIVAAGGWDGAVELLRGERVVQRITREGLVLAVRFLGTADQLAVGGSDKMCGVYTLRANDSWELAYEVSRKSTIHALAWDGGRENLAIASKESVAVVQRGVVLHELEARRNTAIAWSPSSSYLCVCGERTTEIYETENYRSLRKVDVAATSAAWGRTNLLALGGGNSTVSILKTDWDNTGSEQTEAVSSSSYFASATNGDWVLKDHVFGELNDEKHEEKSTSSPAQVLDEPATHILAMAFSKGSKYRPSSYFCTSANNGMVLVRNCSDWKLVAEIQFPALVHAMAFSSGSRYLALGCEDSNVYVSDSTCNWELVAKIEFADAISTVCFSGKNNDRLAVGSVDGTLAFLTPQDAFDFAGEVEGFETVGVTAADWSTKNLAVGRADGSVSVYDSSNIMKDFYDAVAELKRDTAVVDVSFGVSSRFLAVGDEEGSIGVYSAKGGWILCHQIELESRVSSVQWCPLGRHLAFGDIQGTFKVVDTIFWNEITEASRSLSEEDGETGSCTSFSQDGKLLAFGAGHNGFGVMDSTAEWSLVVNHLTSVDDNSSNAPHEV